MQVQITLEIPDGVAYPGVVADSLEKIARYWDEGARSGDLVSDLGGGDEEISWESKVTEEQS